MKQPYITVFILVYNNADGLSKTVESVMNQTYTHGEVILSDDGSSNYDRAILEDYAKKLRKKFSEVKVNINEKNIGTVKHLNKVFQMAEGEYLISCSSGDAFYNSNTLKTIVEEFEKKKSLILTTRRLDEYGGRKRKVRPGIFTGIAMKLFRKRFLQNMICKKNILSGCCTFYKKELFERHGYFDESYHLVEDYPYYVELLRRGETIAFSGKKTVRHGIGGVSTGKVHPSIYKDIELLREKLYLDRNEFDEKTKAFLEECHREK